MGEREREGEIGSERGARERRERARERESGSGRGS